MNIQLIQGQFNSNDAIDLISEMIQAKIRFHENKIKNTSNEEDIKMRESRIKRLQSDLYEMRTSLAQGKNGIVINSLVEITP